MMSDNIGVKLFFVILYAAMAYFTFTGNMQYDDGDVFDGWRDAIISSLVVS